jgi:hypothetical protein
MLYEPGQQRKSEPDAKHVDIDDGEHQRDVASARDHWSAAPK